MVLWRPMKPQPKAAKATIKAQINSRSLAEERLKERLSINSCNRANDANPFLSRLTPKIGPALSIQVGSDCVVLDVYRDNKFSVAIENRQQKEKLFDNPQLALEFFSWKVLRAAHEALRCNLRIVDAGAPDLVGRWDAFIKTELQNLESRALELTA